MADSPYKVGEPAERLVEELLKKRGYWVTPARTHRVSLDSAPLLHGKNTSLIQPDIFAIGNSRLFWAEVKQKTSPQKVYKRNQYEHGIERRQYEHYKQVVSECGHPVYLFVYEECNDNLLFLDMTEHSPYAPLSESGAKETAGSVMVNFPRKNFTAIEFEIDLPEEELLAEED